MQVTETLNSGLKREIKVTVPASDMEERLMKRLVDVKDKVRINGFRPGKVPVQHLRKVYGKSFMAEVVNEILTNSTRSIITERGEKAAMQPEVKMTEDEKEAEKILNGGVDFEFELAYEVIPAIEVKDFSGIKVTRKVYDVPESEIDEQVKRVAESAALLGVEGRQGRSRRPRHHGLRRQDRRRGRSRAGRAATSRWCWARRNSFPASKTSWSASRPATRRRSPSPSLRTTTPPIWPASKPPSTSPSRKCPSPARWRSTTRRPRASALNRWSGCARS